jgi:hypothetical protein
MNDCFRGLAMNLQQRVAGLLCGGGGDEGTETFF